MEQDFVADLWKVMNATTPQTQPFPVLTVSAEGYSFNGENYGNDAKAAQDARDEYYNKKKTA